MKKLFLIFLLTLVSFGLFAEERTPLFKREKLEHYISLEKVIDDDNNTYFYIMTLEPEETRDNYTACYVYLWGNSEESAKVLISGLTEEENYYDYLVYDIGLEVSRKDINFSDDKLVHCYYFSVEIVDE